MGAGVCGSVGWDVKGDRVADLHAKEDGRVAHFSVIVEEIARLHVSGRGMSAERATGKGEGSRTRREDEKDEVRERAGREIGSRGA